VDAKSGTNGQVHIKRFSDGTVRTTVIPIKSNRPLPPSTLRAILGVKQTNLRRQGLQRLLQMD